MRKLTAVLGLIAATPMLMAEQAPPAVITPPSPANQPCAVQCFTPTEAVTLASQVAPKGGLSGRFAIFVKAAGAQDGRFYLNSEPDYRDRNCLTVALSAEAAAALAGRADLAAVQEHFVGKWIFVDGVARRVKIVFLADGKPTEKYYYQVHVVVRDPRQIRSDASEGVF